MLLQKVNLINASASIFISLWMYYDALNQDFGLLIPLLFGVVLLSLNNGILYGNIAQKNAAFVITILSALFLFWRILVLIDESTAAEIYYYILLGFTSFLSIIAFIWSGFRSKKAKQNK